MAKQKSSEQGQVDTDVSQIKNTVEIECVELVKQLVRWLEKYPKSKNYLYIKRHKRNQELITIEDRAVELMEKYF